MDPQMPEYGDTPARRRTVSRRYPQGISDRQAAGVDPMPTPGDVIEPGWDYSTPRRQIGMYFDEGM